MLPSLLRTIKAHPGLPGNCWYFVSAVTLSCLNKPDHIPAILTHALQHGAGKDDASITRQEDRMQVARRLRESLVKSAAIIGLPKTINALMALKAATPADLVDEPMSYSPSARPVELYDMPSSAILDRGQRFFDQVYGKISKRVMGQMDRAAEDLGLTARLFYGYLLSNSRILTPAESSFVLLAGLIPQDVNPQLKGHLKGALNNGASVDEVMAVRDVVMRICEAYGMKRLAEGQDDHEHGWKEEVAKL